MIVTRNVISVNSGIANLFVRLISQHRRNSHHPPTYHDTQTTTVNTSTTVKSKPLILLQTARATAFSRDGNYTHEVHILFAVKDCIAITQSLKTRLKLTPIKRERLNLNTKEGSEL